MELALPLYGPPCLLGGEESKDNADVDNDPVLIRFIGLLPVATAAAADDDDDDDDDDDVGDDDDGGGGGVSRGLGFESLVKLSDIMIK